MVDLQSGPLISEAGNPSFLAARVAATPGSRGVAIETGDFKLAYQGISPTSREDLNFARMLVQNMPEWPGTGAAGGAWPPWRFDPHVAFPKTGNVVVLQRPAGMGQTPVPEGFYTPVSATRGRPLPVNLSDVAGLSPTSHPQLYGKVDQMFWRRPFGLGKANQPTIAALAGEVNQMLKPEGFIEFRVLPASDARRALEIAGQIPGSRTIVVPQNAINSYATTNIRPPGLTDEQWGILEGAGPDIRGEYGALGGGVFNRIIRVYSANP
jgi:hypothetical protein